MCTMEKIIRRSGADSNIGVLAHVEGVRSAKCCDDGTLANATCHELNKTYFKHFRTLGGHCNNVPNPMYGTKGSRLSRLLPAEHTRLKKATYPFFAKPTAGNCIVVNRSSRMLTSLVILMGNIESAILFCIMYCLF